jgi:hypothetical protein
MHAGAREMKRTKKSPFREWFLNDEPSPKIAEAHHREKQVISAQKAASARVAKAIKDAADNKVFDAAVAAEAQKLNREPAISQKFVDAVSPGLKERGFAASRDKIQASVHRLRN